MSPITCRCKSPITEASLYRLWPIGIGDAGTIGLVASCQSGFQQDVCLARIWGWCRVAALSFRCHSFMGCRLITRFWATASRLPADTAVRRNIDLTFCCCKLYSRDVILVSWAFHVCRCLVHGRLVSWSAIGVFVC